MKAYNKNRKIANTYKLGDSEAIQKTQLRIGLCTKLKPKFLSPYEITVIKRNDCFTLRKLGYNEGPKATSSVADPIKLWTSTF